MKLNCILGAGISGISIATLLLEKGEAVLIADDALKETPQSLLKYQQCIVYKRGLALELADLEYDKVIKSPGLPNNHPLVEKLAEKYFMYSDIEIGYLYANNLEFISITGSNGKTTVTSLLTHLGQGELISAGNIGMPLGDVVLNEHDKKVSLELSSFQCEGLKAFKPKLATILNLTPDHMDRYLSVNQYYKAKLRMLMNMDEQDIFIRNRDDVTLMNLTQDLKMTVYDFSLGLDTDIHIHQGSVYFKEVELFKIRNLNLVGQHNLANAMVAASLAYLSGIRPELINKRISEFKGVEHRLEYVDEINGVKFYNDSKATNPEATQVALASFDKNVHLLIGGYDKHIAYDILKEFEPKLKSIHAFGQTKHQIENLFEKVSVTDTMQEALVNAYTVSEPGDIILLSPASASYDQFKNYEQRGQLFKEAVKHLG